jgi:uncharacterized membrane protein
VNNKVLNILILFLLALFISFRLVTACNQLDRTSESETESDQTDMNLPVIYSGTIPCADCPGIEVYLLLEEKNLFTELNWYRDRSPEPFVEEGTWELKGDSLSLFNSDRSLLRTYLYDGDTITMLDSAGQQITGDLSENYIMNLSHEETSIRRRHEQLKNEEKIRFLASGNEPFWTVRVDSADTLTYITPETEWSEQAGHQIAGEELFVWTTRHENTDLTLTAETAWCRDSMSGFLFTHKVTLVLSDGVTGEFRGCGRFLE